MSTPARQIAQGVFADIERVFALQRAHQWEMKATTAEQRKERLRKLKSAVEAHGDEIVAALAIVGGKVFGGIGGAARGVLRAKTGNLDTVATLAGFVTDKTGRVLVFAIMAPDIPGNGLLQTTANAIDATAAGLAGCGCG